MGRHGMGGTGGVDDDHFDVGIGLLGHAGNRLGQAGPVHAANDDADQRQLLGIRSQAQHLALQGPEGHVRQGIRCFQRLGRQMPEGFGGRNARAGTKSPQGSQRLGVAAVGVKLFLRSKRIECLPLEVGHRGDIDQRVVLGRSAHFVEQQIDRDAGLSSRRHAGQRQSLVVGMRFGEGGQQQPARLKRLQRGGNAFDEWLRVTQLAIRQVPALGFWQP